MVLICGDRSIRFRPHLNVTSEVIDEALSILEKTLKEIQAPVLKTS
jgi:L-lysine 6-transaminase